jgi:hypothetical protein
MTLEAVRRNQATMKQKRSSALQAGQEIPHAASHIAHRSSFDP